MENQEGVENFEPTTDEEIDNKIGELMQFDPSEIADEHKSFLEKYKDRLTEDEILRYGFGDSANEETKNDDENNGEENKKEEKKSEEQEIKLREVYGIDDSDLDDDQKVILNKLAAPFQKQQEFLLGQEISRVIESDPNFAPYKSTIEKYAKTPEFKYVPIDMIAKSLAYDTAKKAGMKQGSEAERKASQQNARRSAPGSSRRGNGDSGGIPDAHAMSDKEFEEYINKQFSRK